MTDEKQKPIAEDTTMYGEFIASYNGWTSPELIKKKSKEMERKIETEERNR